MKHYRYPSRNLRGDYARAGIGMLLTGAPMMQAGGVPVMMVALGGLFLMFLGFGIRTWTRHRTRIGIDEEALHVLGPRRRRIPWDELEGVTLKYFSTRRDRTGGWMELTLRGRAGGIKIDSSLERFDELAALIAGKARDRGVAIDETSRENFAALGIGARSAPTGGRKASER